MGKEQPTYKKYIIEAILSRKDGEITKVVGLESLNSRFFIREEYPLIENFLKEKNIEGIINLPKNNYNTAEYLDIVRFRDQNEDIYIATIYDNDELWQNPEVIEIYRM